MVLGFAIVAGCWWLGYGRDEEDISDIVVILAPIGMIFGGLMIPMALSGLIGTRAYITDITERLEKDFELQTYETLDEAKAPFWVCASCRIIVQGEGLADRCAVCGSPTDFVRVPDESQRSMARAMMGPDA